MNLESMQRASALIFLGMLSLGLLVSCGKSGLKSGPTLLTQDQVIVEPEMPELNPDCPAPPATNELLVVINEVMIDNVSSVQDGNGEFSAWLELYNPSSESFNLGDVSLSDDLTDINKWKFPCPTIIEPGEFLVVYMDGDDLDPTDYHASFIPQVSFTGEYSLILNGGSDILDVDLDDVVADVSYGRFPDGESLLSLLAMPPPGEANSSTLIMGNDVAGLGDINQDGSVDSMDLDLLLTAVFQGRGAYPCQDSLDVNNDGEIGITDINYLSQFLDGSITTIPAPFPIPGPDTGSDSLDCF